MQTWGRSDLLSFRTRRLVAFVGNGLDFPRHNIELVKLELEGVDVARFDSLKDLRAAMKERNFRLQVLVLPECRSDDLKNRPEAYEFSDAKTRIVLNYSDVSVARRLRATETGSNIIYVPVNCTIDAWTAFIRLAVCGQEILPEEILAAEETKSEPLRPCARTPSETKTSKLTKRELEVLELVSKGMMNRVIGENLGLSEHTVKLHLHHVFNKLHVRNRASAAALFLTEQMNAR